MSLFSISIDLDEIACYEQIHGLQTKVASHAVYDVALARIAEFASSLALPVTVFVIARDLERAENAQSIRRLLAQGHEVGNHSLDHFYDLTRREQSEQLKQVQGANEQIRALLGVAPEGFRAPGYTVTDTLLGIVADLGMRYDSSVFPCPPYYAAKASVLLGQKLRGRKSRSILDAPGVLRAPSVPYRIGQPYWQPGTGLLELPIQVSGPLRVPFIGTALTLLGPNGARLLARGVLSERFVNLELHGIDFLEARDVPKELLPLQPDLRVPWERKLKTFGAVVELLRQNGFAALRLDEAARHFS